MIGQPKSFLEMSGHRTFLNHTRLVLATLLAYSNCGLIFDLSFRN